MSVAEIDTYAENPCITWFVRGIEGRVEEAEVYVGADQAEVAEAGRLIDGEGLAPKTLILIDNSLSIGTKSNEAKIKSILTRLIWNHQYEERFAIKTVAEESQVVMDYTDNYDALRLAIEDITFEDQYTFLRNVLYQEIQELAQDGEPDYSRIIIVSDGSDDSKLGVTYEELTDLVEGGNGCCPIYTIGCFYSKSEGILDKLFALSRRSGTPYFSLDDYETAEDAAAIADEIRRDGDSITYFRFNLPTPLRDGSRKNVGLHCKTTTGEYSLSQMVTLPMASVAEMKEYSQQLAEQEKEAEAAPAAQEEAAAQEEKPEPETFEEEAKKFEHSKLINILLAAAVAAALVIFLMATRKKERKIPDFHEVEKPDAGTETKPASSAAEQGGLKLMDVNHPDHEWLIKDGESLVVGRSDARCDIAFPQDKNLASRQMMIAVENGSAVLTVLGAAEATFVNDQPVKGALELYEGDIIRAGNTRLRVEYD
ncbi:MAG: VWA domain-containing protein [Lachnospiraceae bacterium]|nr:VWA domain-containing protein [Lachnospiraceae bacterium]